MTVTYPAKVNVTGSGVAKVKFANSIGFPYKADIETIDGGDPAPDTVSVTFDTPFNDTNYVVFAMIRNFIDAEPDVILPVVLLRSKSASGFTVWLDAPVDNSGNYKLEWMAIGVKNP